MKLRGCPLLFRNLEAPETPVYSVKSHKEIINSIDGVGGLGIGEGAPEIVTGSRDGESKYSVCSNFFERQSLYNRLSPVYVEIFLRSPTATANILLVQ